MQFNPPASPHFGGVFEIMMKSEKKACKGILGNAEAADEKLLTATRSTYYRSVVNSQKKRRKKKPIILAIMGIAFNS